MATFTTTNNDNNNNDNDPIYISMDLESSLGKILDEESNNDNEEEVEPITSLSVVRRSDSCASPTRTSATYPFPNRHVNNNNNTTTMPADIEPLNMLLEEPIIIMEDSDTVSDGTNRIFRTTTQNLAEKEDWGLSFADTTDITEDGGGASDEDDDIYIMEEGLEVEKIEDRLSFWQ